MAWVGAFVYVLNTRMTEMNRLNITGRRNAESCDDRDKARDLVVHNALGTDPTVPAYAIQPPRWFASP